MSFTAKFVVLRCAFCELRSFGVGAGLMQIAIFEHARPAWLAKKKLRMAKEIAMVSGIFVDGRRQTLLYSFK